MIWITRWTLAASLCWNFRVAGESGGGALCLRKTISTWHHCHWCWTDKAALSMCIRPHTKTTTLTSSKGRLVMGVPCLSPLITAIGSIGRINESSYIFIYILMFMINCTNLQPVITLLHCCALLYTALPAFLYSGGKRTLHAFSMYSIVLIISAGAVTNIYQHVACIFVLYVHI